MSVQKKEKQVISIERFHKSHIIIGKILSILIPGAGHLWLDKPFKGAVLSFAFFFLVLQLVPVRELVVNPWLLIGSSSLGGITLLGGLLLILYWYSISHFPRVSSKLSQFLSLIRVTRKELQIKQ
jgi:hypothetical protein